MDIQELFRFLTQIRDWGPKHSWRSRGWFDRFTFTSTENPIRRLCRQEHIHRDMFCAHIHIHRWQLNKNMINTRLFYVILQIHPWMQRGSNSRERLVITSAPHSVTDTTFPVVSIRLRALLETSLLVLVVIRDTSSTLLHTPITSTGRENNVILSMDSSWMQENKYTYNKVKEGSSTRLSEEFLLKHLNMV